MKTGEWVTGEELFDVGFYKLQQFKKLKRVTFISGDSSLYVKGKRLKKLCDVYCAINCTHGLNGEDGTLSGLLRAHGVALLGSPLFASSLSMDKAYTKIALKGLGVQTLEYCSLSKSEFTNGDYISKIESTLSYPLIVKPANLGSSIGISTAFSDKELKTALKNAFKYDGKVVIERYLESFEEYNCAVCKVDDKVLISEIEKPAKSDKILTFNDKYQGYSGLLEREFPAKIPLALANKIKKTSEKVFNECGFGGIIRIDYIYSDKKLYLNEINTVPGSMAYYLFVKTLKGFTALLTKLIERSVKEQNEYNSNEFTYSSGVLNLNGAKANKRLTSRG